MANCPLSNSKFVGAVFIQPLRTTMHFLTLLTICSGISNVSLGMGKQDEIRGEVRGNGIK